MKKGARLFGCACRNRMLTLLENARSSLAGQGAPHHFDLLLEFARAVGPLLRQEIATLRMGLLLQAAEQAYTLLERAQRALERPAEIVALREVERLSRIGVADMTAIADQFAILELPQGAVAIRAREH